MTRFVIDASVAVRWLVELPHSRQARELLAHSNELLAPAFLPAEVGSALTKLVRAKVVSRADGTEAFDDFFRAPIRLLAVQGVAAKAMQIALVSGQGFYDCLYLSLAQAEQALFATADARFWQAMQAGPHGRHIHVIGPEV